MFFKCVDFSLFDVSVKYEEHCDKTLRLNNLNHMLPAHSLLEVGYSAAELTNMEITVLNFFDWSLSVPTVAQFVPYFLVVSVDDYDLIDGQRMTSKSAVVACLEKHTKYFMEISLQGLYSQTHILVKSSYLILYFSYDAMPNNVILAQDFLLLVLI